MRADGVQATSRLTPCTGLNTFSVSGLFLLISSEQTCKYSEDLAAPKAEEDSPEEGCYRAVHHREPSVGESLYRSLRPRSVGLHEGVGNVSLRSANARTWGTVNPTAYRRPGRSPAVLCCGATHRIVDGDADRNHDDRDRERVDLDVPQRHVSKQRDVDARDAHEDDQAGL